MGVRVGTESDELPEHLREPPRRPRDWPLPTAWLLGTKLLGSLRDMLLSSVAKVDLRTWMTAGEVVDLTAKRRVEDGEECCYVDFLADTGDSQRLVYQLARLLKQERLEVKAWQGTDEVTETLPRGALLVMGGDIAYPIATHRRLLERVRAPFLWAHAELAADARARLDADPVILLAVPGNHDYYDGLRGFEALVHSPPVTEADAATDGEPPPPAEQPLRLPGYRLAQHASYFAAALPFGWRLWGLDVEMHDLDDRQAAYFEWAKRWRPGTGQQDPEPEAQTAPPPRPEPDTPDRLILVTSRPAFVYQGPSDHADVIADAMKRLDLTPAFARDGELEPERVRLDLSGDVHLYGRYWGTDHTAMPDDVDKLADARAHGRPLAATTAAYEAPERYRLAGATPRIRKRGNDQRARRAADDRANYASVVSGLGGTFHHPSQIRMGTTPPRAAWPNATHSAREIGVRLADPYQMFRAGAVGVVGLAIALVCYLLIWDSDAIVNVLDVPFAARSGPMWPDQVDALRQLGRVAAIVGLVVVLIALPIVGYY